MRPSGIAPKGTENSKSLYGFRLQANVHGPWFANTRTMECKSSGIILCTHSLVAVAVTEVWLKTDLAAVIPRGFVH